MMELDTLSASTSSSKLLFNSNQENDLPEVTIPANPHFVSEPDEPSAAPVKKKKFRKKVNLNPWTTRENLALVSAVEFFAGIRSWTQVEKILWDRGFAEHRRPEDWFSPDKCAKQYDILLEEYGTILQPILLGETLGQRAERFLKNEYNKTARIEVEALKKDYAKAKAQYKALIDGTATEEDMKQWSKDMLDDIFDELSVEEVTDDEEDVKSVVNLPTLKGEEIQMCATSAELEAESAGEIVPITLTGVSMSSRTGTLHADLEDVETETENQKLQERDTSTVEIRPSSLVENSAKCLEVKDMFVSPTPSSADVIDEFLNVSKPIDTEVGSESEPQKVEQENIETKEANEQVLKDVEVMSSKQGSGKDKIDTLKKRNLTKSEALIETETGIDESANLNSETKNVTVPTEEAAVELNSASKNPSIVISENKDKDYSDLKNEKRPTFQVSELKLKLESPLEIKLEPISPTKEQSTEADYETENQIVEKDLSLSVSVIEKEVPTLEFGDAEIKIEYIEATFVKSEKDESVSTTGPNSPSISETSVIKTEEDRKVFKKSIQLLHATITGHKNASLFHKPIKEENAPGYYKRILSPIDLSTIKRRIDSGEINSIQSYERDLNLMLLNAKMYNSNSSEILHLTQEMAIDCWHLIEDYKNTQQLLSLNIQFEMDNNESLVHFPIRRTRRRDSSMTIPKVENIVKKTRRAITSNKLVTETENSVRVQSEYEADAKRVSNLIKIPAVKRAKTVRESTSPNLENSYSRSSASGNQGKNRSGSDVGPSTIWGRDLRTVAFKPKSEPSDLSQNLDVFAIGSYQPQDPPVLTTDVAVPVDRKSEIKGSSGSGKSKPKIRGRGSKDEEEEEEEALPNPKAKKHRRGPSNECSKKKKN